MNKGFTLMELLAVILILGLLTIITSVSVSDIVKDTKNNLSKVQIKLIKEATKNYFTENMNQMPNENSCSFITLKDLNEHGYISSDIINPKNNKKLSEDLNIKVIANSNSLEYEVDSKDIEDCLNANIILCRLNEGIFNELGSKYTCNLGKGNETRNFYLLDSGTNTTSSTLILEGNYDKTTQSWCVSDNDNLCNANGLNEKLEEISNVWLKLEKNQIKIPSIEQIVKVDNQEFLESIDKLSSLNSWLYNWPNNNYYGNNKPYGYWTSTTYEDNYAWYVYYNGTIGNRSVDNDYQFGVRPIILIPLDLMK